MKEPEAGRAGFGNGKVSSRYVGNKAQVTELRQALLAAQEAGTSQSAMLRKAGLDDPNAEVHYEEPNLSKFLSGKIRAPRHQVAAALYEAFVPEVAPDVDLIEACKQFGQFAKLILGVEPEAQEALDGLMTGYYHFYVRSLLVPGHYVKGLLSIADDGSGLLQRETQYHDGCGGLPEQHETWKGYVMRKGSLIFMAAHSYRLRGVSFTIIDRTVKLSPGRPDGMQAGLIYGKRLQCQENQGSPMTTPYAATRIPVEWVSPEAYKGGVQEARLGIVPQLPPLLRPFFHDAMEVHAFSEAAD